MMREVVILCAAGLLILAIVVAGYLWFTPPVPLDIVTVG